MEYYHITSAYLIPRNTASHINTGNAQHSVVFTAPQHPQLLGGVRRAYKEPLTSRKILCVCIPTMEIGPIRMSEPKASSRVAGLAKTLRGGGCRVTSTLLMMSMRSTSYTMILHCDTAALDYRQAFWAARLGYRISDERYVAAANPPPKISL